MDLNRMTIIGRLGRDMEIKTTKAGKLYAKLSVATNKNRKVGDTYEEETTWHNVITFQERLVKILDGKLNKGDIVFVEGTLSIGEYTDNDGVQRRSVSVDVGFDGTINRIAGKQAPTSTIDSSKDSSNDELIEW